MAIEDRKPTERQLNYLKALLRDNQANVIILPPDLQSLNRKEVAALIDRMLSVELPRPGCASASRCSHCRSLLAGN